MPKPVPLDRQRVLSADERSTASDHRRTVAPRGQVHVTDDMREAMRR